MKIKFTLLLVSMIIAIAALSQGSWNAIAPFPDARAGAIGISVGGKAYVGMGVNDAGYHNDLWEYDPASNAWSPLATMPGPGRQAAIAFAVNGKIYVGLGIAGFTVYDDLYEYDPATNSWSGKAAYGGGVRYGAMAFSIGDKGYVGFGKDEGLTNGTMDFWQYDPVTDNWEQKMGIPVNRSFGIAFSIGNKGYVGLGVENYDTRKKDIWQYDPGFNEWIQKRDFPGERYGAVSFTIGLHAYAGAGFFYSPLNDFHEYNEVADIWSPVSDISGGGTGQGVAFGLGDKGFAGLGYNQVSNVADLYAFHFPRTPAILFDPVSVITLAGSGPTGFGEGGFQDGPGNNARFNSPMDVATDAAGNIFLADNNNHRIRKITPEGVVTTIAGTGVPGFADGSAWSAQFAGPNGIAVDASGNIFIADRNNHRIRKINSSGEVSTVAGSGVEGYLDGPALTAMFHSPFDIAVDKDGNIFVTDYGNERIRKISTDGMVSTFAGNGIPSEEDGVGTNASFIGPQFLAFDNYGGLYVTEIYGKLRKISPDGLVRSFQVPGFLDAFHYGVAVDENDNLYVAVNPAADLDHIFKISPNGNAQIIAGGQAGYKDSLGVYAQFYYAFGITSDPGGNIIVADIHNNRVRKLGKPVLEFSSVQAIPSQERSFNVSGVNLTTDVNLSVPEGFEISLTPGGPYTSSLNLGANNGEINLVPVYIRMNTSTALALSGNVVMNSAGAATQYLPIKGTIIKPALLFDPFVVTTFAGNGEAGFLNGAATVARFNAPLDVTRDALGNTYVADSKNNRIRRISPSGYVSNYAGSGLAGYVNGNASSARFNQPNGVAVDGAGNVFVTEFGNPVIRKITTGGIVSTFAGSGVPGFSDGPAGSAQFLSPKDLVVDQSGNVFVVDQDNHAIRKITPAGQVITIAGNGTAGHDDGTGVSARFYYPQGIALDPYGNLWVTQLFGQLRKISPAGMVTTILTDGFVYGFRYGVVSDPASNIYVSVLIDDQENRIYKVTPGGTGALVAGGVNGFKDSTGADARFSFPEGLTIDNEGSLYVADNGNNRIRKISTPVLNFTATAGTASEVKYFKLSGVNLGTSANVTVPGAFEISLTPSGGFSSNLSLSPVNGEFTSTTVYIRMKSTTGAGVYNGYIVLSSPGAVTRNLRVSGIIGDNVPPVVNCVSSLTLCYNSSNSYSIPLITATDQSAFRSFTYAISGATNRSGSGRNASGYFSPGISTIVWRVTDIAGNVGTCTTTVRVDYRINVSFPDVLPNLVWGQTNTIYRGFGVPCAILAVFPSGGTPYPGLNAYRYRWSNGATTQSINVCPTTVGNHVYTVTITDALGCSVTLSKTIKVVDVRCGPNNNEVTMCWFGTSQVCYSTWQAIIAMYYGAQIGPCSQYRTITTQVPLKKGELEIQEKIEIKAYPNPNNGSFKLQFSNVQAKEIRVFDRDGKLVLQKAVVGMDKSGTMDINLGPVTKGVYLVQVIGEKVVHTVKVVVM